MGKRVYNCWLKTASMHSGAIALTDEAQNMEVTFDSIQQEVNRRIGDIERMGDFQNRVIAFQFQNSLEWLATFLTCQAVKAIALPIDPDVPPAALESLLSHLRASAIWRKSGPKHLNTGTVRKPACLVKLTSGSTGTPRPIFFEDEQMLADGRNIMQTMGIKASDSNLATIPFGHSYGLGNLVMPCIMKGCAIHICQDPFPHAIAAIASRARTTVYPTVPAILKAIIRSGIEPSLLNSIRLWISAGSSLDPKIANQFKDVSGKNIHNFYGSSETGGIAYDRSGMETLSGRSVGKPLHGVQVSLSQSNRLVVTSDAVFKRHNPRSIGKMGQYLLPDVASILEDGSIRLGGRKARMVKLSGKRLSLLEVEKVLMNFDGVDACFVDQYKDAKGRTRLGSVLVTTLSITVIQSRLKSRLAAWKIPARWILLDALPVNARGKTDRKRLQKMIHAGNTIQ